MSVRAWARPDMVLQCECGTVESKKNVAVFTHRNVSFIHGVSCQARHRANTVCVVQMNGTTGVWG